MPRRRQFAISYGNDVSTADVILNTGAYDFPAGRPMWPKYQARRAKLAADLWIGCHPDREAIMDACEQRGANTLKAFRQFPSHYAFFRTNPPNPTKRYDFDSDRRLRSCLQLSRLVRPSETGYYYSARVLRERGRRREIVPYAARGIGTFAFSITEDDNWFGDDHVQALRRLLRAFDAAVLPDRVSRSLWYHEYIFWTQMIDVRWPLCVTALEALVHTDEKDRPPGRRLGSTEQFVRRLLKLKEFVKGIAWEEADLREIYDKRSGLVHGVGRGSDALTPESRRMYQLAENALRTIIVDAIYRPAVADMFASKATVRTSLGF